MTEQPAVPAPPQGVRHAFAENTDSYHRAVGGIEVRAIRAAAGGRPSEVSSVTSGRVTMTTSRIGFPMITFTEIGDERILLAHYWSAPPGCRHTGIDLEPGTVLAYGPRLQHVGRNREGLAFSFVTTVVDELHSRAEVLGVRLGIPEPGEARPLTGVPATAMLVDAFSSIRMMPRDHGVAEPLMDDLLSATVRSFAGPERHRSGADGAWIPSQSIVHRCIDFAESVGRRPSLAELCLAARVSERRLRSAFIDEFDQPPAAFFRMWALAKANQHLAAPNTMSETVTSIALQLGFGHVGRFAEYYRRVYEESPMATLRRGHRALWAATGEVRGPGT